jgi:hypothetical protein
MEAGSPGEDLSKSEVEVEDGTPPAPASRPAPPCRPSHHGVKVVGAGSPTRPASRPAPLRPSPHLRVEVGVQDEALAPGTLLVPMLACLHLLCHGLLLTCRPHLILALCILGHLLSIALRPGTVAPCLGTGGQRLAPAATSLLR